MRIGTIETALGPRAAVFEGDSYVDVHASDPALPDSVRLLLESGNDGLREVRKRCLSSSAVRYRSNDVRLLPPVLDPRKIVCLGLNYRAHAAETGAKLPLDPILFSKFASALIGHEAAIVLPAVSEEVDFEAELVVVIGKRGRPSSAEDAWSYVAGYTIGHDVSARDWQLKKDGKQWLAGKTFDTFAPTGPWMVTADEVPDPHSLDIRLRLNGQVMQDSNTREMIFKIDAIIAYVAKVVTLEPGDLIFTGTPPGVGIARKPPVFLKTGDVVEVEISRLGLLRNHVVPG